MYCYIQEIQMKSSNSIGCGKELCVTTSNWTVNGVPYTSYGYTYSDEKFERPIKTAYKITLHDKSYRDEKGRVQKKQYHITTIKYYDLVDYGWYDCIINGKIDDIAEEMGIDSDLVWAEIENKLYALQNKGLKLYCMHDLDISGVNIFKSFQTTNDKFEHPIDIEDLGITIEDVYRYNIQPEQVEKGKSDRDKLLSMSDEYRSFFDGVTHYNRVELNAFTTEQILEIMDRKLSAVNNLPKINLVNTFEVDHEALRDVAFMRVMSRKYKDRLSDIYVPCDLSSYEGRYTVDIAKKAIPEIKDELILRYEQEIEKKLNIF